MDEIEQKIGKRVTDIHKKIDQLENELIDKIERKIIGNRKTFYKTPKNILKRVSILKIYNIGYLLYETKILRFLCSENGGYFKSSTLDLNILKKSVKNLTVFEINQISDYHLKYPLSIKPVSPAFEFLPHSTAFKQPIQLVFHKKQFLQSSNQNNIYLFKQEIDYFNKNLWSVYFLKNEEFDTIEFEVNNFSRMFIASCEHLNLNVFNSKYKDYQIIKPGLNYRISCNNSKSCINELIIVNMGFSENSFIPYSDSLICPVCKSGLTISIESFYNVIKTIILFECNREVKYNQSVLKKKTIKNQLELISLDESDRISSITINVKRNDDDQSSIAGLNPTQFNVQTNIYEDVPIIGDVSSVSS